MRDVISVLVGKSVRALARLRGGGSALPGLVVERIDPLFLQRTLARLPFGVVAVSGTNGKTTTTKMITELFEAHGLRVFTNRTGSNYSRGIVAAVVSECSLTARLDADVAVLELDEAHAMSFITVVQPQTTLLLNVLRDQLDRFGEIDVTAGYLRRLAAATTSTLVANHEDPHIREIAQESSDRLRVVEFGLSDHLRLLFPNDNALHASAAFSVNAEEGDEHVAVRLVEASATTATIEISMNGFQAQAPVQMQLSGLYNKFNAVAALATVNAVVHQADQPTLDASTHLRQLSFEEQLQVLAQMTPAFGRGERITVGETEVELILVKNPAGFRLALASYDGPAEVMIAINDQHADGRDMSWLWDVDFSSLAANGVSMVSGSRSWDMTLRLQFDDVNVEHTDPALDQALRSFLEHSASMPHRIFCTYTAMLQIRAQLAKLTKVENIW